MADTVETMGFETTRVVILDAVRRHLEDIPDSRLAAVEDPDSLAELMTGLVPGAGEFSSVIGPVYSTRALETMWGITRVAVSKRVRSSQLFALKIEGQNVFPLFQFDQDQVRSEVVAVAHRMLSPSADPWAVAAWLCTSDSSDPRGGTFLELLRSPAEAVRVMSTAISTAERWAT